MSKKEVQVFNISMFFYTKFNGTVEQKYKKFKFEFTQPKDSTELNIIKLDFKGTVDEIIIQFNETIFTFIKEIDNRKKYQILFNINDLNNYNYNNDETRIYQHPLLRIKRDQNFDDMHELQFLWMDGNLKYPIEHQKREEKHFFPGKLFEYIMVSIDDIVYKHLIPPVILDKNDLYVTRFNTEIADQVSTRKGSPERSKIRRKIVGKTAIPGYSKKTIILSSVAVAAVAVAAFFFYTKNDENNMGGGMNGGNKTLHQIIHQIIQQNYNGLTDDENSEIHNLQDPTIISDIEENIIDSTKKGLTKDDVIKKLGIENEEEKIKILKISDEIIKVVQQKAKVMEEIKLKKNKTIRSRSGSKSRSKSRESRAIRL